MQMTKLNLGPNNAQNFVRVHADGLVEGIRQIGERDRAVIRAANDRRSPQLLFASLLAAAGPRIIGGEPRSEIGPFEAFPSEPIFAILAYFLSELRI